MTTLMVSTSKKKILNPKVSLAIGGFCLIILIVILVNNFEEGILKTLIFCDNLEKADSCSYSFTIPKNFIDNSELGLLNSINFKWTTSYFFYDEVCTEFINGMKSSYEVENQPEDLVIKIFDSYKEFFVYLEEDSNLSTDKLIVVENVCVMFQAERRKTIKIIDLLIVKNNMFLIKREKELISATELEDINNLTLSNNKYRVCTFAITRLSDSDINHIQDILNRKK